MSFPVVLGSVKSGAFSPTSSAVATPATPSTPANSTPDRDRFFMRVANIFPSLHETISAYSLTQAPRWFASAPLWGIASSDDPIGPIQYFRCNRESQSLGGLQIDDKLDLRIHLHRDFGWLRPLENLVYQAWRL